MSECYDAKLCEEKHKQIDDTLELQNNRLNKHSEEIHSLQNVSAGRTKEMEGLTKAVNELNSKIEKLVEQNRNLLITIIVLLAGFFIFAIEKGIFK
ncbi:hypothetical protein ACJDU8_17070 [Clostridium sp. WILCCON 0269]|uniref:Uncharacterized protein n=1 Tax=Candidatus Clostridium eludens TaxID=3381663 RepID=A0ABW8SMS1_9CLOT